MRSTFARASSVCRAPSAPWSTSPPAIGAPQSGQIASPAGTLAKQRSQILSAPRATEPPFAAFRSI